MLIAIACPEECKPDKDPGVKLAVYCNQPEMGAFIKSHHDPSTWKRLLEELAVDTAKCSNWPNYPNGLYETISVNESCPVGSGICCPAEQPVCIMEEYDEDGDLMERMKCSGYNKDGWIEIEELYSDEEEEVSEKKFGDEKQVDFGEKTEKKEEVASE